MPVTGNDALFTGSVVALPNQGAARYAGGNAYVGAGPGTGKTFLLVERYRFLRESNVAASNILILTFSRRAVDELKQRLAMAGFDEGSFEVRTFHGFSARVLGGGVALFKTGRLLDELSRKMLLASAVKQTVTPALGEAVRRSVVFESELSRLFDDVGKSGLLADGHLRTAVSARLRDVLAILENAVASRARIGGSDIDELISRSVSEVRRPGSISEAWLKGRYTHVLVDEFQDTDRTQLDLLSEIKATIFAVGDEAQSIYRFRGATNDIVLEAIERFAMQRFALTESKRCPPDVCVLASSTPIPNLTPLKSSREKGEAVDVVRLRGIDDEVAYLADDVERELNNGRKASEIAVLLRAFRPLGPLLVAELRRRDIAVVSTGREDLIADARVTTLLRAFALFGEPQSSARWKHLLSSPSLNLDPIAIRLSSDRSAIFRLDDSLSKSLLSVCGGDCQRADNLAKGLLRSVESWRAGDIGKAARRLVRGLALLGAVIREEAPSDVRAAAARLTFVCDTLAAAQRTAKALGLQASCLAIAEQFEEHLPELSQDGASNEADASGVRVLTVHASKGLQFPRTYIADAVNGRFPQDVRASTLLTVADRELLAAYGVTSPLVVPSGAMLEEASLWYVAVTRCSDRLTITFSDQGLSGDIQRPSRFLVRSRIPEKATIVDREPLVIRALRTDDSKLRAQLVAAGVFRDAPATSDFASIGYNAFEVTDDTAIFEKRPIGVGDAELWLQCPRQLFYRKFAKLDQEKNEKLELGSLIHKVLERFHTHQTVFDSASSDAKTWSTELLDLRIELWNAETFGSVPIAEAASRAADAALASYARSLAILAKQRPFTVEACERPVEVPVGHYGLSGRVDRIDVCDDGTRTVVDYKLGTAKQDTVHKLSTKLMKEWRLADDGGRTRVPLARRAPSGLKLQLAFYAAALENVRTTAFVFMGGESDTPNRNGAFFELSPLLGDYLEVRDAALKEIEAGLLQPLHQGTLRSMPVAINEDTCEWCPYTGICPGAQEAME